MKNILFAELLLLSVVLTARCQTPAVTACSLLQDALPDKVFFPGSQEYLEAIAHFEPTSSENSTCSVEPTSVDDVSTVLKIIGRDDIRAPFAVKSSGHADNVGFSSTPGVQIAMSGFTNVSYDPTSSTATFGPGLPWDKIYEQLQQFNVTVVGGRVPGVGTGLLLGGGYSWVSDQYGLGIDNIVSLDLVLPNGTFVQVTEDAYPDLMFGLKGGLNNFGIVTSFTVNAFPLSTIWGGVINYAVEDDDLVAKALADFSVNNTDLTSQIAAVYIIAGGQPAWQLIFFHDGPTVPDVFQPFLQIPSLSSNTTDSFTEFLSFVNPVTNNEGGFFDVVPIVSYTGPIIEDIKNQINRTYTQAVADGRSVTSVLVGLEPFTGMFQHTTPSAYPHPADREVTPCNPFVTFTETGDFDYFLGALRNLSASIQAFAIQEGQSRADDLHYPNYALAGTPLELMYGDNLDRLHEIKVAVDPDDVMGLTGGWKF